MIEKNYKHIQLQLKNELQHARQTIYRGILHKSIVLSLENAVYDYT